MREGGRKEGGGKWRGREGRRSNEWQRGDGIRLWRWPSVWEHGCEGVGGMEGDAAKGVQMMCSKQRKTRPGPSERGYGERVVLDRQERSLSGRDPLSPKRNSVARTSFKKGGVEKGGEMKKLPADLEVCDDFFWRGMDGMCGCDGVCGREEKKKTRKREGASQEKEEKGRNKNFRGKAGGEGRAPLKSL